MASDTPALREVGGTRRRYPPADDPGAWAEAIGALASDGALREARAEAGIRRAATFVGRAAGAVADAHRDAAARRLVVVDCHMVGQAAAGDAGNGRYAVTLLAAMAATAGDGDRMASLVATPEGARALERFGATLGVPQADVPRLARAAPRALADAAADVAVFTYVSPG